jgi:hypothetical protein
MLRKAPAFRSFPFMAGGGYDQGLANVADLVGDDFRVIAPSRFGYLGTPCLPTHRAPPKPMRMQRFSPN